ncbi:MULTISPECIES: Fe2+-dependent dioxygenase [Acinetobacter]|uniref:Fe2+-dependent dioxygenase n=1 Tax=Acinetobacter TaxID=469 RepID=UPI0024474538|nr:MULTISPECIES: Fe2+-dependent dioxygenase [Acinetobacter]MDH0029674.1 Fe2+-dependent dioxygenase [Acinetobacter sp. GD04021]MDH0887911.1 Fe2+-dependent dioxygenase [Acinetobacter sp. GD03873]MDH1081680.1 Fe2+-dependent dioxygenase [Acinetobacter sp. GD03983]MDH2191231.1 Fe2+-dependent dioxygenase [Acinetobacter sp. GD03645]MDH2204705.1 Fe2+-dependent dioxygenase [Acinetobacter sp. GD03647]
MLLHVPNVLSKDQVQSIRQAIQQDNQWVSGKKTAGSQAIKIKNNLQIDIESELYQQLSQFVIQNIKKSLLVQSFALPNEILLPMFNCYQDSGNYGNHVDNAILYMNEKGKNVRTDVSMTIFLSEPDEYEGGELIIEDTYGAHEVKLDAGDAIVYPATSLHRVEPVTNGARIAAFTWIQSIVKDDWQRTMLFNLDMTILKLRQQLGDTEETVALTSHYHNLLRQWGDL